MIQLTPDQEEALNKIKDWWDSGESQLLTFGGYAGTGKSTVLKFLRDEIGDELSVGFVSLTGKAVSVMRKKLSGENSNNFHDYIQTMHSFMYKPEVDSKGNIVDWYFKPMAQNLSVFNPEYQAPPVDLFINDEASMTSQKLYDDLASYERPILAVGDHGQLPPINSELNLMENPDIKLSRIHRQVEGNPILSVATMARQGEFIEYGSFGPKVKKLHFGQARINSDVESALCSKSLDNIILVAKNSTRVQINKTVRKELFKISPKEIDIPIPGDKVICLRNNSQAGIYNGMQGIVQSVKDDPDKPSINYQMRILADDEMYTLPVCKHTFNNIYGRDPDNLHYKEMGTRWDFGYAITVHKSQGSEYSRVIIWGNTWTDHARWLYTAVTRAQDELYIIQ